MSLQIALVVGVPTDSTFHRKFHDLASQRNFCFHILSIDSEDLAFDLS